VCEEHVTGPIDFLKIDVEGFEEEVIAGANWQRFRPTVVVVEATHPQTNRLTHGSWDPLLREAGYTFELFDGLNRFYLAEEHSNLADRLHAPANTLDHFVLHRWSSQFAALREYNTSLVQSLEETRTYATSLEQNLEETRQYAASLEQRIAELRAVESALLQLRRRSPGLEAALARANAECADLRRRAAATQAQRG
jgi:hypothetical protein